MGNKIMSVVEIVFKNLCNIFHHNESIQKIICLNDKMLTEKYKGHVGFW